MSKCFLEVKGIYKSFGGVHALKNVNLKISVGESLCLVGENGCGKSTLIKIISGAYERDAGEIYIEGVKYDKVTPMLSSKAGIQVIYQDFSLFHNLSVAENIAMLYNQANPNKFSKRKNIEIAKAALDEIGVKINPEEIVGKLPIAHRQIVAICRALVQEAKLIIMDEPTTALTSKEVDALYKIIENLKAKGIALIFVSHKLEEVFRIAERIEVMRNGENVISGVVGDFNIPKLTYYMTGKQQENAVFGNTINKNKVIFSCSNMTANDGSFKNISFNLYEGEVLGITGLLGSGREALAEALFGAYPYTADRITLCGKDLKIKDTVSAIKEGIGYVPEDRALKGLFMEGTIGNNICSAILYKNTIGGFINWKRLEEIGEDNIERLNIVCAGIDAKAQSLSGGNQQKIVIAKAKAMEPKLIVFNCPTVGVDVGSKADIHNLAKEFAARGVGIIIISDDLTEILNSCNRVYVMNRGQFSKEISTAEITNEELYQALIEE